MGSFWILLVAVLATGHCQLRSDDDDTSCPKVDVNAYMEKVLVNVRKELPDPIRLPPKMTIVDMTEGLAWGLSELTMVEPATHTCDGSNITINLKLTTEQMKGRYTWKIEHKKVMNDRQGFVTFISNDFEAEATIVVERREDHQETHPRLERFVINKFKDAKIEITGMGVVSWAIGELTTLMSGIFQRSIAASIQEPIKEALERQMREISLHD